jgi:hypothetical protein
MVTFEAFLWYLVFLDAIFANLVAWCCAKWYKKKFKKLWNQLPITKGWTAIYLILIIWLGVALLRLGILPGF